MGKIVRNDACSCGSGKKYKHCCMPQQQTHLPSTQSEAKTLSLNISKAIHSAVAHHQAGRWSEAEAIYRQILILNPANFDALHFLGVIAYQTGQCDQAIEFISQAIKQNANSPLAHYNLGKVFQEQGRFDEAEACYRRALAIKVNFAEAHYNLGNTLQDIGRLDAAVASYRRVLEIKPDYAKAHNNLGIALHLQGKHGEAVKEFLKAHALKPDYADPHSSLIFFLDMTVGATIFDLQAERKKWGEIHAAPLIVKQRAHANDSDSERRLRVGYVSADFRNHSATRVFGAMLIKFDPSRFDVFAYSNTKNEDDLTQFFQKSVTGWRNILGLSDDAAADLIRKDKIDILVDLSGHSAGNRLLVFARKPAPLQITAWGYATSTGMKAMDVFFADPVVVPPVEKPLFVEEVRYLPNIVGTFFPDPFPPVNALPALSAEGVTFGSFNRLAKVSEAAYDVWSQVLLAVPHSRLVLKTGESFDQGVRDQVFQRFMDAGIAPERLLLLGNTSRDEHLAAFNQIDISLDPFPHGGGVTTLESLMMGVPVVSLRWPTIVGRLSASILTTLGLTDWIAETPEQYIQLAIQKTQNLRVLSDLRQQLHSIFASSIFGNTDAYVRIVEQEYRQLWRKWCECQKTAK